MGITVSAYKQAGTDGTFFHCHKNEKVKSHKSHPKDSYISFLLPFQTR